MLGDLRNRSLIVTKGVLFLLTGLLAAALIVWQSPGWVTVLLLLTVIWGFCRFYYFLFHVLESYVAPSLKWRGLVHLVGAVIREREAAAHEKTAGGPGEPPAVM